MFHTVKARSALGGQGFLLLNERKGKPVRNYLTARWRRYAVAFVVAAASLGVVGACSSLKPSPPPQPNCPGADSETQTCLTIQPTFQNFSRGQTFSFTITNVGPGNALLGPTVAFNGESFGVLPATNGCAPGGVPKTLSPGASCTFAVQAFQDAAGQIPVDYAFQVCDNCQRILNVPNATQHGIAAQIVLN